MLTPYDWQEGMGHRSSYVESKLAQGAPVLALSLNEGVLMFTYRRHSRKIYEIYDQLMFGAIGQQSDVESLRVAAIDFAHQEGFNRSEQDVTIQRVVTALSGSIKKAFGDFNTAPFVAKALFAEVCEKPGDDQFYILDYDGDFTARHSFAYCAGSEELAPIFKDLLSKVKIKGMSVDQGLEELKRIWLEAAKTDEEGQFSSDRMEPEAALLERGTIHEQRFRMLVGERVGAEE
jgi:proteasome alpha subunit